MYHYMYYIYLLYIYMISVHIWVNLKWPLCDWNDCEGDGKHFSMAPSLGYFQVNDLLQFSQIRSTVSGGYVVYPIECFAYMNVV